MVPGIPAPHLVNSQAEFAVGLALTVLDEEALRLRPCQIALGDVGGGIGETIVGDFPGANFAAHQQMPAAGLSLGAIPHPDAGMQVFGPHGPFLACAQGQSAPGFGRLRKRPSSRPALGWFARGAHLTVCPVPSAAVFKDCRGAPLAGGSTGGDHDLVPEHAGFGSVRVHARQNSRFQRHYRSYDSCHRLPILPSQFPPEFPERIPRPGRLLA